MIDLIVNNSDVWNRRTWELLEIMEETFVFIRLSIGKCITVGAWTPKWMKSIPHTNIDTITRQYRLVDGIRVFRPHVRIIYKTRQNGINTSLQHCFVIQF